MLLSTEPLHVRGGLQVPDSMPNGQSKGERFNPSPSQELLFALKGVRLTQLKGDWEGVNYLCMIDFSGSANKWIHLQYFYPTFLLKKGPKVAYIKKRQYLKLKAVSIQTLRRTKQIPP